MENWFRVFRVFRMFRVFRCCCDTPLGCLVVTLVSHLAKPCKCISVLRLCRTKKKAQGEGNATAISNLLPFLEYELHTQLMNKLKLRSMNALFGLRIQISVGENMLLGLAVSTASYMQLTHSAMC